MSGQERLPLSRLGRNLRPWGCCDSRGRLLSESPDLTRGDFERDRDRIIHSDAFRRLKHKTQVFVYRVGDHYRTRLTHTLEVSQLARSLARSLGVDEDLAEALALAHDFGHPPFGHGGERALDRSMQDFGGFDHNLQSFRIVTLLERRYASFDGLNLTWESLEGLAKHNGPVDSNSVSGFLGDYNARHNLELDSWCSIEAQCASIADDIAYDSHDLDDGLRAGLFGLSDVRSVSFWGELLSEIESEHPDLDESRVCHELVRRQITRMVEDVIIHSGGLLSSGKFDNVLAVRSHSSSLVSFSPEMSQHELELKDFLFSRMYRHPTVMKSVKVAESVVSDLFGCYMDDPPKMPGGYWDVRGLDEVSRAVKIGDYISGMTDGFAISEYRRLFGSVPDLRS